MESTIKNASEIAGDAIDEFKQFRRKQKIEREEVKRQSSANFARTAIMALILVTGLLTMWIGQNLFF